MLHVKYVLRYTVPAEEEPCILINTLLNRSLGWSLWQRKRERHANLWMMTIRWVWEGLLEHQQQAIMQQVGSKKIQVNEVFE